MVCLANSRKNGKRCIAGIDLDTGNWVRPVKKGGAELSELDIEFEDHTQPEVLDIIT